MTTPAYPGPNVSTGNGVTTVFPYSYTILRAADLKVTVDGVVQTLTTHYAVSGVGESAGGNVTFVTAPANGLEVVLSRARAYTRVDVDYQRNGSFDEETVDADFDALMHLIQQLNAGSMRAIKAPESVSDDQVVSAADWAAKASKFFGFNSAGVLGLYALASVGSLTVSAFIETLFDDANAAAARATLGVPSTAEAVLVTGDQTVAGVKTFGSRPIVPAGMFAGYLNGLTLANNGADATNDIDIAAGSCRDSTDVINIVGTAMTKRLDAGWVAGTNQGYRNSAAAIADTTYHIYAVCKAAGADPDYYAHTSTTVATVIAALQAEAGGAAYLYARRIGSIIRSAGAIVAFNQNGDEFLLSTMSLNINTTAASSAAVLYAMQVPAGIKVKVLVHGAFTLVGGAGGGCLLSSPDEADIAPVVNTGKVTYTNPVDSQYVSGNAEVRTNTSREIRVRCTNNNSNLNVNTYGWIDRRGRDA